jgi:hypothetical protein
MAVNRCYVYFDKALTPRPLEPSVWFVRIDSRRQNLAACLARVDRVQLDTTVGPFDPGPDEVAYYGGTAELRDVDGLRVLPFFHFPITRT